MKSKIKFFYSFKIFSYKISRSSSVIYLLSPNPIQDNLSLYLIGHKHKLYTIGPNTGPLPASSMPNSYSKLLSYSFMSSSEISF